MHCRIRNAIAAATLAVAVATGVSGCALGGTGTAVAKAATGYSYVAVAIGQQLPVYRSPGGQVMTTLANPNVFHDPLVLLARSRAGDWIKVLVPIRPNGATGWVPASAVQLTWTPWKVVVTLHTHQLVVYDAGHPMLRTKAGTGATSTPTPLGTFYITTLLRQPDPNGAYGPYAFGLSGFSPVLKQFDGGPGQIGLHGTDASWSIGRSVTHGCIRVSNSVITTLAARLPLGTPVVVQR